MMVGGGREEAAERGRSLDYGAWIMSDSQDSHWTPLVVSNSVMVVSLG